MGNPTKDRNRRFLQRIRLIKVKDALRIMNVGKAVGLDEILIKVWKYLGDVSICWFTNIFNKILSVN